MSAVIFSPRRFISRKSFIALARKISCPLQNASCGRKRRSASQSCAFETTSFARLGGARSPQIANDLQPRILSNQFTRASSLSSFLLGLAKLRSGPDIGQRPKHKLLLSAVADAAVAIVRR